MDILDFLTLDNYAFYNKTIAQKIGVKNAIVFNVLCNEKRRAKQEKFSCDTNNIADESCLNKNSVETCLNELCKLKYIKAYKDKNSLIYYSINIDNVLNEKAKHKDTIEKIIAYLNEKTKKQFRATSASAVRPITARLGEKYTFEDFKKVIDIKTKEWLGTSMEQYLRPETLFGSKFDGYLQCQNISYKPKLSQNVTQKTAEELNSLFDTISADDI